MRITAAALTFLLPALAFAAEHGGGHGEAHHEISWYHLGGQFFTFFVFVIGLVAVAKKPIQKFFVSRHEAVKIAVEEAQRAKLDAEAKARHYEEKIKDIDAEMKKLAASMQTSAAAEKQRLLQDAEETARRIAKDAESIIATELEKAQNELKKETVEMALKLAEEILRREIKGDDQKRLVAEFTEILSGTLKQKAA
ncbi:MAG: ATP synthase F0 subunit B [Deltaproteobacteria bacterium]|nr:ATP synthase F0 subunit B [Deltaproteobacteria bacterium]